MGFLNALAKLLGISKQEANILVIGLDNSGKTTILNHLAGEEYRTMDIVPTIGFNVQKLQRKALSITTFDMSGQGKYRILWEQYYRECHGIIFVVDSSDKIRLTVAKDELSQALTHPDLEKKRLPVLFFANKMDLREALSSVKVSSIMDLDKIQNKPWHICASNGLTGEGLHEGVEWITDQIKGQMKK